MKQLSPKPGLQSLYAMAETLLKDLNPEQKKAVLKTDGPVVVLAGAGSGKTKVLTYKVIYLLLEKHVDPTEILMVTFTNKAATEMKERIDAFFREELSQRLSTKPLIATFHALCAKILRMDGKYIGISPRFSIY